MDDLHAVLHTVGCSEVPPHRDGNPTITSFGSRRMTKPTRILILGGGFAGTTVALLSDTLSAPGSGKKSK